MYKEQNSQMTTEPRNDGNTVLAADINHLLDKVEVVLKNNIK